MLEKFIDDINRNKWHRHLLFLCLTLITIFLNGYHFGSFDHVFHITFLKKLANPSLYPNDPFLLVKDFTFSYFWQMFLPAYKVGILEPILFIVHIAATYGTFWMFWELSQQLFRNKTTNVLVTFALIFPHIGFPGFQIIEFELLNRTFVLPFLLAGILFYLKRRYVLSFLIIGVMFNFHVIYSFFVLLMILFDTLLKIKHLDWKQLIPASLVFLASASPVLYWRLTTGTGIDLTLRPDILDAMSRSLLNTVYFPIGSGLPSLFNLLSGLGTVAFLLMGITQKPAKPYNTEVKHFAIAIGIVIIAATLASYFLPITIILQFQALRIGVFLLYFGYLYFADFLVQSYQSKEITGFKFSILAIIFISFITPLIAIVGWYLRNTLPSKKRGNTFLIIGLGLLQSIILVGAIVFGYFSPGFHIYGTGSTWVDAQLWAKENTSEDSLFITPPDKFWHYTSDWRVFSERSSVATIPEIMVVHLSPESYGSFVSRFDDVAPGALAKFNSNYVDSITITRNAYRNLTSVDYQRIAQKYQAEYLVVEKPTHVDFQVVYENLDFIIYSLPFNIVIP